MTHPDTAEAMRLALTACICDTCEGEGTIDETLGGYSFSNPKAQCPDCDGRGAVILGLAKHQEAMRLALVALGRVPIAGNVPDYVDAAIAALEKVVKP